MNDICYIFLKKSEIYQLPLNLNDLGNAELRGKVLSECESELVQIKTFANFITHEHFFFSFRL